MDRPEAGAPGRGTRFRAFRLLVGLLAAGCAASTPSPFDDPSQGGRAGRIQLVAENREFADATLWAITSQRRERLGIVTGKASERFTIDWPAIQDLSIEIHLLAGETHRTPRLTVTPGDQLRLFIERPVNRSVLQR